MTAQELTGSFDVVVLAVKADVLDAAVEDVAPAIGPSTVLIPFLNGMGHVSRLVDRFGSAVAGGVLRIGTERVPRCRLTQAAGKGAVEALRDAGSRACKTERTHSFF